MKDNELAIGIIRMEDMKDGYEEFLASIKNYFHSIIKEESRPLFTTDASELFEVFLNNLPVEKRQNYTCNSCRYFVERFGNLVWIEEDGQMIPAVWSEEVPEMFLPAVEAIRKAVISARVNGIFVSDTAVLGKPQTGVWHHMSVELPETMVSKSRLKTPYQIKMEKIEEHKSLINGLQEYSLDTIEQAVMLLKTEVLYRSEKCLGVAEWLQKLQIRVAGEKDRRRRENIIWLFTANAPIGYCHVKSSMIGTLLDDIAAGLPFESVKKRFAEKMNPLQYQRPQVLPSEGNIEQAEKIIEKLGLEKSLSRRFARLEELETIWLPREEKKEKKTGVFAHLKTKEQQEKDKMNVEKTTMTWRKFQEIVLPMAEKIEYLVKSEKDNFCAILTALNLDAPPIIQWDMPEQRNPFSLYVYSEGSLYRDWNLKTGFCEVTGICFRPSMWHGKFEHHGRGIILILKDAKDKRYKNAGNALFPEILKSELHEIRKTIEAYSKNEEIHGYEEASACGMLLQKGGNWKNTVVRVSTKAGIAAYQLDRWD